VGAIAAFSGTTSGNRYADILLNSATPIAEIEGAPTSAGFWRSNLMTLWYFEEGDYIEVRALASAAGQSAKLENFWIMAITPEQVESD